MASLTLNQASKNGQHVAITATFASLKEGFLNVTSVTLGDGTTVAATFPGYVSATAADAMKIPCSHVVSIA